MTSRSSNDAGREATTKKALTPKASDVLPLSLYLTNVVFFMLFFSVVYYLLYRWCDKIRNSTPRHVVTLSEILAIVSLFRSSRFARLQSIHCSIAGRNLHMRFSCSIGDAMGMNVVSKGLQNVLDFLQNYFLDMDVIGISGKQLAPSHFCCYLLEPPD